MGSQYIAATIGFPIIKKKKRLMKKAAEVNRRPEVNSLLFSKNFPKRAEQAQKREPSKRKAIPNQMF